MSERPENRSPWARLIREPTLHFALLAALFFAVERAFAGEGDVIRVERAELALRLQETQAERGVPLTPEERGEVERAYVEEQVLLREALARGLEDDPRVTDFLVQKMLHVLSADVIQPSDAELLAFYEANRARYTAPAAATVDELVVATSDPLPAEMMDQLRGGAAADALRTSLPLRVNPLGSVTREMITPVFGEETARRIFEAPEGSWVGPHETVRGQHWFRVTGKSGAESAPLAVVREQVRLDWIAQEEGARLAQRVAELTARYSVVYVGEGVEP